jgi:hypothetical protein
VVAAPLWAIMHLTPSGDDIMGGARQGYMMILGVLLRPVLIILGFIFSLIAADKVAGGFNMIFFPAFKMAMTGSVIGLGTSLAMVAIYFGSMVWILHTVFGLIHVIPDKLLRWIGGGHEQLGESARGLGQTGSAGAKALGEHARGAQSSMVTGLQTKSIVDSAEQGRKDRAREGAARSGLEMREKSSSSAVHNAKADAPGARADAKLSAISSSLEAAGQMDSAISKQEKSDKLNKTTQAETLASTLAPEQQALREQAAERAGNMAEEARAAEDKADKAPASAKPAAMAEAKRGYSAASSAYQMLSSHELSRRAHGPLDASAKEKKAGEFKEKALEMRKKSQEF